jgi:hypothetical protein
MSQQPPDQPRQPSAAGKRKRTAADVLWGRVESRRQRIRADIARERAGGHKIPTWAMAVVLGLLLLGWVYLILTN